METMWSRKGLGCAVLVVVAAAAAGFGTAAAADDVDTFFEGVVGPEAYVLSKLASHRVVFFGESHWVADEVELVAELVPRLADVGTRTLAVEVFPAGMQEQLDRVVGGAEWDEPGAMAVLRAAEMPHGEYLDIIQAVWRLNRERGPGALALVAMGPGPDWRETLPPGEDYETFMADRIRRALEARGGSVLAYMGLHHAFTRYVQPESTEDGRAWRFMVRAGNTLWWEMGETVFALGTHHPVQCRKGDAWGFCLPFDGAIDCAADRAERAAFGFDVAGSPFAELRFDPGVIYAAGYPDLRFVDFIDGWVRFAPVDDLRQTRVIPIHEYAPDETSLAAVRKANPFDGRELSQEDLESLWLEHTVSRSQPILENRWKGVPGWRDACDPPAPAAN
jgi:hypothetical protein